MEFNLAEISEAIAAAIPDRECIVVRDRRFTWTQLNERTRRLGNYLHGRGLGCHAERAQLQSFESGQDHLGIYLYNGNEYLEAMLGSYKARVAPFNVNYRYVDQELTYLLNDADARALVYHARFAPNVARIRAELPNLDVLIQVADDSGHALLPGAVDYEEALRQASPERPALHWSADDLYILYTGGTTGMPKGVLWRQEDIFFGALGGQPLGGTKFPDIATLDRGRQGGQRPRPAGAAVHARRRPLDGVQRLSPGRHRRHPEPRRSPRPRRHLDHDREARGDLPDHRRRRLRPAAARSAGQEERTTSRRSGRCSPAARS